MLILSSPSKPRASSGYCVVAVEQVVEVAAVELARHGREHQVQAVHLGRRHGLRGVAEGAEGHGQRQQDPETKTSQREPPHVEEPIPMREPQNPGQSAAYYPAGGPRRKARRAFRGAPGAPLDSPRAGGLTFLPLMRGGAAW